MKRLMDMRMVLVFSLVFLCCTGVTLASSPPKAGEKLPDIQLPVPDDGAHREYLGLLKGETFGIADIEADVVIIEVLNVYCPTCQRMAPRVDDMYELIEKDEKLKGRAKIIGIGAGNSATEIKMYRETFKVPFPLFTDSEFILHKQLGEVKTPYFMGVRIADDGSPEVFFSKLGAFDKAETFLETILEEAGIEHP